jgi:hypothetical protein
LQNCFIVPGVDQIPPLPLGQPNYHIEGLDVAAARELAAALSAAADLLDG